MSKVKVIIAVGWYHEGWDEHIVEVEVHYTSPSGGAVLRAEQKAMDKLREKLEHPMGIVFMHVMHMDWEQDEL